MRNILAPWLASAWRGRTLALGLAALAWAAAIVWGGDSIRLADERASDWVWRLGASEVPERRVVIVDIDDASLAQVGPWPWPRAKMAELTRKLDAQGVGLKLFDVVFADSREGSSELAAALAAQDAEAPSVLAQVFAVRGETRLRSGTLAGALAGVGCQAPAVPAQGYVGNAAGLHSRAGHVTATLDADGAVRRLPAFICFEDRTYPGLVLAGVGALGAQAGRPPAFDLRPGQGWWDPAWRLQVPGLPGISAGLDRDGQIRVPFRSARSALTAVSAADVLNDKVAPEVLRGAWVLVGASAFGLVDAVPTAQGGAVSGVEVHAQLLAGLIDGEVPMTPRVAPLLQAGFVVLALGALLLLASGSPLRPRQRVVLLPLAALVAAGLGYALHAGALLQVSWYVGWAPAALAILLGGFGLALAEHARSLAEKGRLFRNLSSYVPGPVAERIALTEPTSEIDARRSDVTVLAADLQNFSRYCEARAPEDAARVLHRFFTTASGIIEAHGGVVEEMVGDSLLAVFNGPRACEDHPQRALAAAHELWLRCTEELPNVVGVGLEPLSVSVGLETGTALVGSFGPAQRKVHTVLGSTVTIALRLQGLTADVAYPVLVGQGAAERIGLGPERPELALKPLGSFLLPGLQHGCKVFTLRALLQPGSPAEQSTLRYLHLKKNNAA